jgi:hypothetical protein
MPSFWYHAGAACTSEIPGNFRRKTWPDKLGPTRLQSLNDRAVRVLFASVIGLGLALGYPSAASARGPALIGPQDGPEGQPQIVLDRLVVPVHLPEQKRITGVLERALKAEARKVEWGAGRKNRITYRFYLEQLDVSVEKGVLRVRCTALGKLPKGKTARSRLEFGGDAHKPRQVIDHVLTIVARGVLARLADLERTRRGRK